MLLRRVGEDAESESHLRSLVSDPQLQVDIRAEAWYELAAILDKAGQIRAAYEGVGRAEQLYKPYVRPHLREHEATLNKNRELVANLDAVCYERWKTTAAEDSPYRFAVLTSHPRSGTTLVEQVLDSHDQAISADEFDVITHWIYLPIVTRFPVSQSLLSIFNRVPPAVRQQARATYWHQTEAILDEPIGDRLLVDKNPAMTMLLPVVNGHFPK